MKNIHNLTIVIPVHKITKDDQKFFESCITSLKTQNLSSNEVVLIHTKETDLDLINEVLTKQKFKSKIKFMLNEGKTDFYSQVNTFAKECKTEWFSILEFDDQLSKNSLDYFIQYKEAYSGIKMFLPLVADTDTEENFLKFGNDMGLVNSHDNLTPTETIRRLGFVDFDMVNTHVLYRPIGAFIKTGEFIDCGMFKTNIKFHQQFEFMLRWCHKENETMTMFKLGYQHIVGRKKSHDSIIIESKPTGEEFNFWLEKAKKEYYFPFEREIDTEPIKKEGEVIELNAEKNGV